MAGLTGQPLTADNKFNWVFLVELLVCGIAALFFLFYFNRLFATLVSYGLRAYTWHKYRVYIDIEALQISFLGGRVLFKGLRYHGVNETVHVHDGYITWQYWYRNTRSIDKARIEKCHQRSESETEEDSRDNGNQKANANQARCETGGLREASGLPFRISVSIRGLEWFVYNRSPAYDGIISRLQEQTGCDRGVNSQAETPLRQSNSERDDSAGMPNGNDRSKEAQERSNSNSGFSYYKNAASFVIAKLRVIKLFKKANYLRRKFFRRDSGQDSIEDGEPRANSELAPDLGFLNILPLEIQCHKGAFVVGNETTRCVLTVKFSSGTGQIDIGEAGSLDHYKQLINFEFSDPVIQLKPNPDFTATQNDAAIRIRNKGLKNEDPKSTRSYRRFFNRRKRQLWRTVQSLVPYFQTSVESLHHGTGAPSTSYRKSYAESSFPGEGRWVGLTRYLDDNEQDGGEKWTTVEYARYSTILDCPSIDLTVYWDVPGVVPDNNQIGELAEESENINNGPPPEWGIDVRVRGGDICYGPWTDRQRADLQNAFFPNPFMDSDEAVKLEPGASRISTMFRLRLDIEKELTMRIPTREGSKDWQWKGQPETTSGNNPQQKQKGKRRHSRFSKAESNTSTPNTRSFGWLSLRIMPDSTLTYTADMIPGKSGYKSKLNFDLQGTNMSSSVNHGDLWQCGPQIISCDLSTPLAWDGQRFWKFDVVSDRMDMFLLRDHMFLLTDLIGDWASGPSPEFYTFVPFHYSINIRFLNFKLYLNVNDANIIDNPSDLEDNTFVILEGESLEGQVSIPLEKLNPNQNQIGFDATGRGMQLRLSLPAWNTQDTFLDEKTVGSLKLLTLSGYYDYFSQTSTSLTDTLFLDIGGFHPAFTFFGFALRYFMQIKENYFGDDVHFKTLEEYQGAFVRVDTPRITEETSQLQKVSNDLDVILSVTADNICALFPATLYEARESIKIDADSVKADLRFTNYYMDIEANFSPLAISLKHSNKREGPADSVSGTELFIDGFNIYGHRLFGLPPTEPTYVCNWDFDIGCIKGECSGKFLRVIAGSISDLMFSLDDKENALPSKQTVNLHDVTFLRLKTQPVCIWVHINDDALLLDTASISLDFNDRANSAYSEKLHLTIPNLTLSTVAAQAAIRNRGRSSVAVTYGWLQTTVEFTMIERKPNFGQERALQQEHVRLHDQRTLRTSWLLPETGIDAQNLQNHGLKGVKPPAMPFPQMPEPIIEEMDPNLGTAGAGGGLSGQDYKQPDAFHLDDDKASVNSIESVVRRLPTPGARSSPELRRPVSSRSHATSFISSQLGDEAGMLPSSLMMGFSSSWSSPYFPLQGVQPDPEEAPNFYSTNDPSSLFNLPDTALQGSVVQSPEEDVIHKSFVIDLQPGLRGFASPRLIYTISQLLDVVQPPHPAALLDKLQIDSISEIEKEEKLKTGDGQTLDFNISIPIICLRFMDPYENHYGPVANVHRDQYDLSLNKATVSARFGNDSDVSSETERQSREAFHVSIGNVTIAAQEQFSQSSNEKMAVRGDIREAAFWLVSSSTTTGDVKVKAIEIVTSSNAVAYLATLGFRIYELVDSLTAEFKNVTLSQNERLRSLAYYLTMAGGNISDPPFLTRHSGLLRAADRHLRSHDSWKIVARFRYIYEMLSPEQKEQLIDQCEKKKNTCPPDGKSCVIDGFDAWRSWDLAHVQTSYVMQKIWGSMIQQADETSPNTTKPIQTTAVLGTAKIILDPGPNQNEIIVDGLSCGCAINALAESGDGTPTVSNTQTTTVNAYVFSDDVTVRLNWELCELAEEMLKLYHSDEKRTSSLISIAESTSSTTTSYEQLHVVFGVDTGTLTLDGIHLELVGLGEGLKGSVIQKKREDLSEPPFLSVLLSAETASIEALNHSQSLVFSQVDRPSISISRIVEDMEPARLNLWKVAGATQRLSVDVTEDILTLLEIANGVVVDEVRHIHRLVLANSNQDGSSTPTTCSSTFVSPRHHKFTVALFLDAYTFNIALFQSLSYVISGTAVRTSIAPLKASSHAIDFDIHEQTHGFESRSLQDIQNISLLEMPPINGRIIVTRRAEETVLNISTTFESIMLDAAAVHGVLTTVNRPEVSAVIKDIRRAGKSIQKEVTKIFGSSPQPQLTETKSTLVYYAHVAMAGLGVHATTHGKDDSSTTVDFNFGSVQIRATNRLEQALVLKYPEISLHLHQIVFALSQSDRTQTRPCGNLHFGAYLSCTSKYNESHNLVRAYEIESDSLELNMFAETAPLIVDVLGELQSKMKELDLSREVRHLRKLRRLTKAHITFFPEEHDDDASQETAEEQPPQSLFNSMYSLQLRNIQISWIVGHSIATTSGRIAEDLVFSCKKIDLATRKENAARLMIQDLQLQMVPSDQKKVQRSLNSALLPEVIFNVAYLSTKRDWRIAFQAAAKSLDLRITSDIIIPASMLQSSIATASTKLREATAAWAAKPTQDTSEDVSVKRNLFGKKKLSSLLIDTDFAGAVVYIQSANANDNNQSRSAFSDSRHSSHGRYGQFYFGDTGSNTTLRSPGVAVKIGYKDFGVGEPSLNADIKVDASSNILYPTVVPLILEISSSIKEVVGKSGEPTTAEKLKPAQEKFLDEKSLRSGDPSVILGQCRLNIGLRICRQEFSLSCQPIARVAATACFEDIYFTINTVQSVEQNRFFAISSTITNLQASVQHVYSRESTASFDVQSIVLSFMNSRHVSGVNGLSAIIKVSPMKTEVNAKQLQDFLLFREIWFPPSVQTNTTNTQGTESGSRTIMVQKYQQVANAGAFPWNATIAIEELDICIDLGQALGKPTLVVSNFWVSSKKTSNWEQNLCIGFDRIGIESAGRMSGFVNLQQFRVRGSIRWPSKDMESYQTPLVQASIGFDALQVKAAFDYQAFLICNISTFEILMYNVREELQGDRLVGILDGNSVQVFCTSTSASEALALMQALSRLGQEKQEAFRSSLRDIEKFLRRKSARSQSFGQGASTESPKKPEDQVEIPISLQTDVVVTLKSIHAGAFPGTFFDNQVFKIEASDTQARFAVVLEGGKVHSGLGLTLGQLRVALSGVHRPNVPKALGEVSVDEVATNVIGSRGGTILKVPKVIAKMQTWQAVGSNNIDYIFKSSFEGKVDVGWNYARISFIRSMWMKHTETLAQRLGKPLPRSAVQITGGPRPEGSKKEEGKGDQEKITAVVNVPQSKFEYTAMEQPTIDTPQLRDMGEATPPLEWIGLHRDRLPNITHQLLIVTLLGLAKEVEDAYLKILGST
ncbi:MAG: hypothetical protein M1834_009213 [Cirrosporium novae-zelandiae]|nr:MAG: hypothetical protein M1834_009213 [Cirrosporium novae-zelandiae]